MAPDDPQRRASDFSGGQFGDPSFRDTFGGDQINQGLDPAKTFDLVKFFWEDRQQRDIRRAELDQTLQEFRDTIELYRITLAQRLEALTKVAGTQTTEVAALRADVAAQATELAALRQGQRIARWWLGGLTLALLLAAGVVGWLVWRETLVLAARAMFDAAVPFLALRRR